MRKIILSFFVFALIFSGVAQAADAIIDVAGAATLKKQIEDDLQWRNDMTKIFGQGLVTEGKVAVTPKGSFYEVQLPRLSVSAGPQGKLDIGAITFNAAPGQEAGSWQILQATLPLSMTFYDAKNVATAKISIGSQKFSATWQPDKGIYPKVDSLFENIKISGVGKNAINAKIATLSSHIDLKNNGDSTWSGPADFDASGITADVPGHNPVALGFDKMSSHNTYDRLDMSQSLNMKAVAQASIKDGLPQTDHDKKAFLAKILTESPFSADSISGTLALDKFFLHDTGTPQQPRRDVAFDHLVFSGTTTSTQQDKSKLFVKTAFDGLHISFIPPLLAGLLPHTMDMEITFDNMPVKKMASQLFTIVQKSAITASTEQTPEAHKQANADTKAEMATAASLLPKILEDAGASLTVDSSLKSDALGTSLKGKIDANNSAALGATGRITIAFKGLDELVHKMQGEALQPGADPHAMGYFAGLMGLQIKGQPDKAADGTSIRNYIIEVKQNGDILLNGETLNPKGTTTGTAPVPPVMPHSHPMIPAPLPGNPSPPQP